MQTNNKYGTHSWGTVLFLLVVLFLTGCTKEHTGTGENTIAFNCSILDLHATKTTTEDMQYFRVSAVWNKGNSVYESFMNNQLVEKQNGNWVYSPIKNWPSQSTVSFFAYSPATSSGLKVFNLHPESPGSNQVTIEYTVSKNYQEQEDFMVATCLNKAENPVKLKFEHVLSTVNFRARSNHEPDTTFRIKEIKLNNLNSSGIITKLANEADWRWYGQSAPMSYVVYQKYPFETQGGEYKEVGSLIVLPQTVDDNVKISVLYDIIGKSENIAKNYTLGSNFKFEQGKKYTINLNLSIN